MRAIRASADAEAECTDAELRAEGIRCESFDPGAVAEVLRRIQDERGWVEHEDVRRVTGNPRDEADGARDADEHCHLDDEVRLLLEGQGLYDIRCTNDDWVRLWVGAGDLIVVPARRYHRFVSSRTTTLHYVQPYGSRYLLMQLYRASGDRTRAF